jgi:hypothetical protein
MDRAFYPMKIVGSHNLTAQALDGTNRTMGVPYTVLFDVAAVPVTSLFFAKTTDPVPVTKNLSNTTVVNEGTLLTVCAQAPGAEKVRFYLDGLLVETDDSVPVCIQNDYDKE